MFNSSMGGYSLADVAAATGNNRNNDGWGDGGAWWIVMFVLFFAFGGFGYGNGWGGFGGNGAGAATAAGYVTQADLQRGFDTQAVTNKLNGLENGLCSLGYDQLAQMNSINQNVSNTGFGIQSALCQGFNGVQQAINADTVANMQNTNAVSRQLADCCCENREAIMQTRYDMATQNCATNNMIQSAARDITDNANANTRSILDFLVNDKIATLTAENQSLKFQASQTAQNSYLAAMSDAQTAELIRRINPMPVPAYSVPAPYPYAAYGACGACNC